MKGLEGETKERTSIGRDLCYKYIFCMIPIIASIFIIKIAEFAHVLFKLTGDGEAAIAQSLTNWVERMRRTYLVLLI